MREIRNRAKFNKVSSPANLRRGVSPRVLLVSLVSILISL